MKKVLTAALAALTLGGAVATAAAPADARPYDGHYYGGGHYYRHDNGGAAVAAGVVGLALGAALASNAHPYYYDRGYYDRGYYGPAYYGPGYYAPYRVCETTRWVWDPYVGHRVPVAERYAC
jgi:hypothetical protein